MRKQVGVILHLSSDTLHSCLKVSALDVTLVGLERRLPAQR